MKKACTRAGFWLIGGRSAAEAATTTTTVAAAESTATTTASAMASAVAAGQAVDAGAGRIGLSTGLHRFAARQVQACKLCCLERVDVARQFVAITGASFALIATLALTFRTRRTLLTVCARSLTLATALMAT